MQFTQNRACVTKLEKNINIHGDDDERLKVIFELNKGIKYPTKYHLEWKMDKSMMKRLYNEDEEDELIFESEPDEYGMFIMVCDSNNIHIREISYPENVFSWSWNVHYVCKELDEDDTKDLGRRSQEKYLFDIGYDKQPDTITIIADIIIDTMYDEHDDQIYDISYSSATDEILQFDQRRRYLEHMMNIKDEERDLFFWLKDVVGYDQYFDIFVENGFETLSSLKYLRMEELKEIGISKIGHRLRLLDEIQQVLKQ